MMTNEEIEVIAEKMADILERRAKAKRDFELARVRKVRRAGDSLTLELVGKVAELRIKARVGQDRGAPQVGIRKATYAVIVRALSGTIAEPVGTLEQRCVSLAREYWRGVRDAGGRVTAAWEPHLDSDTLPGAGSRA